MKIALIIIGVAVIVLYILPVFDGVFNFGTVAGLAFGLFSLLSGIFFGRLTSNAQSLVFIAVVLGGFVGIKLMWDIYRAGRTVASRQSAIVVLGCRVKGDEPSLALQKRADCAYRFLLKNPDSVAVLCGGMGKGEHITEAECLRRILYSRGILNERMILEQRSTTTDENIRYASELLRQNGIETAQLAVATSEYHQKRAGVICSRYGYEAFAQSSHTRLTHLPTFLLREIFANVKEKYNIRLK